MKHKYKNAVFGGTFDHLHKGHKFFIDFAFSKAQDITIGLTSDGFVRKKPYSFSLESYKIRRQSLTKYLKEKKLLKRTKIIVINNIYGNTLKKKDIETIFATKDLLPNIKKINSQRQKIGYSTLEIIIVPCVLDSKKEIISSKRIRNGEIDRSGKDYIEVFSSVLKLPDALRAKLREPFGEIVATDKLKIPKRSNFLIAVGDISIAELLKAGVRPDLSIFDFKSQRKNISKQVKDFLPKEDEVLYNKAGTINPQTVAKLKEILEESQHKKIGVKIIGEEDLIVLPLVLLAPLGTSIFYGQRGMGLVRVDVDERKKREAEKILKKFERN